MGDRATASRTTYRLPAARGLFYSAVCATSIYRHDAPVPTIQLPAKANYYGLERQRMVVARDGGTAMRGSRDDLRYAATHLYALYRL